MYQKRSASRKRSSKKLFGADLNQQEQSVVRGGHENTNDGGIPSSCQPSMNERERWIQRAREAIAVEQYDEAIRCYKAALESSETSLPSNEEQLFHRAAAAAIAGQYEHSIGLHCQLFALNPDHARGLSNLAVVMRRRKSLQWAEIFIKRSLRIDPNAIEALNSYGTILSDLGREREALQIYLKALEIDPGNAGLCSNVSNIYHVFAQIDLAYVYSTRAVAQVQDNYVIWLDHLIHLRRSCDFERLVRIDWWNVLERAPIDRISSSFLQYLVLADGQDAQQRLLQTICAWGDRQAQLASESPMPEPVALPWKGKTSVPMRIGFVSADFRDHSVARFIWPLFEHLKPDEFLLYGYSTKFQNDRWRKRFEEKAVALRDVEGLSPRSLCEQIQSDGIHILFDLTGFTKGSRTSPFAWRAASVQVSWLGYPGSTGIPQMDYLFVDRFLQPAEPRLIREKPLVTAGTSVCFGHLEEIPITPQIPELIRGFLTIGTLNNPYKFTTETIARWSRVMDSLPNAQFLFVRREFESYYLRQNIFKEFSRNGIDEGRIHFFNNRQAGRHYLDCYNEIDFTLDTFPVTGGTTTIDALWMGVPVIGLEGVNIHQRVCSAELHHAGHSEWIATNDDEFAQIALELAVNQALRVELRQSLREQLKNSLLCDAKQFASDFADTMNNLRPSV